MNTSKSSSPAAASGTVAPGTLREAVAQAVRRYLHDLRDCPAGDLYEVVLNEVEPPLLREVLHHHDGNQSRAACALGMSRATLRKKLRQHGIV